MQGQVSAAFDQDQQTQLDAHLASIELADQRHEHGTPWQIINHIAGDINKADPFKVRIENSFQKTYFYTLLSNRNANVDLANKPDSSRPLN